MLNGRCRVLTREMAEGHERVDRDPALLGQPPEIPAHQLPGKAVDAGRHRGVGGEHGPGPGRLDGLVPAQAVGGDQLPDALETEEAGVALVGVEHLGLDAGRLEGPHPADAEEDLLADPVLGAAAVEAVGDRPQLVVVGVDVGVEQVQLDPPDPGPPHLGLEQVAGQVDRHPDPVDQLQGHGVRVEDRIALLLPAVGVEVLAEVAEPVHEPDTGQGDAQAAGRLQVVAGEDAEAAGVLGQGLGDPELRGEVGHAAQRARGPVLEPPGRLEVAAQVVVHLAEEAHEGGVGGQLLEPLAADQAEQPDRVVEGQLPDLGVDPAEQVPGAVVPRPAQVERQLLQGAESLGEAGPHREAPKCPHGRRSYGTGPRRDQRSACESGELPVAIVDRRGG